MKPIHVAQVRGGIEETRHLVYATAVNGEGSLLYHAGEPDYLTTFRSSSKPLQALPLLQLPNATTVSLSDEELAICCASHPGEPRHSALAASVLALSGFVPDDLACGAVRDRGVSPLCHGCSGKHAGMLLTATLLGAPLHGYHLPEHPVQQHLNARVAEFAGYEGVITTGVDGCGVPTFILTLRQMAHSFARLTLPGAPWARIPEVMGRYPELVGTEHWIDVRLMQATRGRLIAKSGADGLLLIGSAGQGLAIKCLDGNTRALSPSTLHVLAELGWLTNEELSSESLRIHRVPTLTAPTGQEMATVRVVS